jgi:cystathionine beta-lyase/cystathionine gamma-synthase
MLSQWYNQNMDPIGNNILTASKTDLLSDIMEYQYLAADLLNKLKINQNQLDQVAKNIPPATIKSIDLFKNGLSASIKSISDDIETGIKQLNSVKFDELDLQRLTQLKISLYDRLRSIYHIAGATITASDFQSPGYASTVDFSMAGRLTGRIHATTNDYKRTQHEDAFNYEKIYWRENIDGLLKLRINLEVVHSGMAAFTTIINFLMAEKKITRLALVGKSTYFEAKDLLKSLLQEKYLEVDESDTESIIYLIQKHQPEAIFLDTITNSSQMLVPNLKMIINATQKICKKECYFVIDNSCAGVTFQPLSIFPKIGTKLYPIVYESLNKFHQFGMDRVLGGIIWSIGGDTKKLFNYRVNLGTNILDSALLTIPTPNRKIMDIHLNRLGRNTFTIAKYISDHLSSKSPVAQVIYPGLKKHPCFRWTEKMQFHGAFFMLQLKPQFQSTTYYNRILVKISNQAKKEKITIVSGTSFGFPITRIYLTATYAQKAEPFIRISPGTETLLVTYRIAKAITKALNDM